MSFSGSSFGKYSRLWLIITGGILLAVGVVMAITLGAIPFAGGTMVVTGGILGLVGLALVLTGLVVGRRAEAVDQLLANGVAGTAQITGLTQTGMYLNEQPQVSMNLLVTIPGWPPYAATHKSFVPLILLGRLTSGAPLAVRVDAADPQRIAVDWQNVGLLSQPMGAPDVRHAASDWLPAHGRPANNGYPADDERRPDADAMAARLQAARASTRA